MRPRLRSSSRWALPLACAFALLLVAQSSRADNVYLKNGEVFENVVAEETPTQVLIRLPGGELRLARKQVDRVVKAESSLERFEARRAALAGSKDATAWFDLARFALDQDLRTAGREAALRAAELDPDLAGLPRLLSSFGYARDEKSGEWLPEAEVMARRGLVLHDGDWVTREERAERLAQARERRERWERELERQRERALAREEVEIRRPAPAPVTLIEGNTFQTNNFVSLIYSLPAPFVVLPGPPAPSPQQAPRTNLSRISDVPRIDFFERQPGSLIPGEWPQN
ncbi:MAG: hypothetical protein U0002_16830 [Thermoanaerobaculia bacterium]